MKINKLQLVLTILAFTLVFLQGCNPEKKWEEQEEQIIQDYLNSIGDTIYQKMPSGLYYLELVEGTGIQPADGDTVGIKYKGKLPNGRVFDTNFDDTEAFEFIVGSGYVIEGLDEGVTLMKTGGEAKFITPSYLAYGAAGIYGVISGYTPLMWEIELVEVRPGPGTK
jgi:FKBP-type peptidyl-prolyl cis-trans isomerase